MHAQLVAIESELTVASARLEALARNLNDQQWVRRPAESRSSPVECVQHLNLTAAATLPRIREGLDEARRLGGGLPTTFHRDLVGWFLWRGLRQPGRFKSKTAAAFVPDAHRPVSEVLGQFRRWQAEQIACVRECDGLPVHRVRMTSPFSARIRYSVYSALTILVVHTHRHLWQAEQASTD